MTDESLSSFASSASSTLGLTLNYQPLDIAFVRGIGCHLFDELGRRYLDAFAGVAVSALGHAHPKLTAAIAQQAGTLLHASNHYRNPGQLQLSQRLADAGFPGRAFFCNSGTEANEAAYKVARLWGRRPGHGSKHRMLAFANSFHGRTLGALSVTANPAYRDPFAPLPAAEFIQYGNVQKLAATMGPDVAAVFVEPIQGEGGVNVPPVGFLAQVRALCRQHDALMICDEVQTGIGRTGYAFGHQFESVTPDVITLAKGLGGGVPIGAALFGSSCGELLTRGLHGSTFGGNPLACAAALTVLNEVLSPDFLAHIQARGAQLQSGLEHLFGPQTVVRGRGLLWGVQLDTEPRPLIEACLAEGLVVGSAAHQTLRIAPPLIINAELIDDLLARLRRALLRVPQTNPPKIPR